MNRTETLSRLEALLPGRNLYDLARDHAITVRNGTRLNKGWVGQTIERVANLQNSNLQQPDGSDFELKSTSLILRNGEWTPKETIKITQLNPRAILEESFESSALWRKLTRLVFVGLHHESAVKCTLVRVCGIDISDPDMVEPIKRFWEDVRYLVGSGEIVEYYKVGTSDDYIQLRPTGNGKQWSTCPVTGEKFPIRAFYATKRLIHRIISVQTQIRS